jgi:predicted RNA-binding Zn-ribbon protein involved in translation (DUF1610 family)
MGSRMVQVKCPKCGQPIKSKAGADLVFYCSECGLLHTRNAENKTENVEYEISAFSMEKENALAAKPHERLYVPFWQVFAQVSILHEEVAGGIISKLASMVAGAGQGGAVLVYVPAIELDAETFKYLATLLTANPPAYRKIAKFEENAERLPCTVTAGEAAELADFIVLSNEAEKPGVLQRINYEMKIQRQRIAFIAFHRVDGRLALAV